MIEAKRMNAIETARAFFEAINAHDPDKAARAREILCQNHC
jgi:hypothetical protein